MSLHGVVGLRAKQRVYKKQRERKCEVSDTIKTFTTDLLFAISCDLKSTTHGTRFPSRDVCCLRFLLSGTVLFGLASRGDSKSAIPFWGPFAGSQRDERDQAI